MDGEVGVERTRKDNQWRDVSMVGVTSRSTLNTSRVWFVRGTLYEREVEVDHLRMRRKKARVEPVMIESEGTGG